MDWVGLVDGFLKSLTGGAVVLIGLWVTSRAQKKAAATQERQVEVTAESSASDQWQAWAQEQRTWAQEERAARLDMKRQVDTLEGEVRTLREQVAEVRGLFNTAVRHIRELRAFIVSLGVNHPIPRIPAELAHLIEEKP